MEAEDEAMETIDSLLNTTAEDTVRVTGEIDLKRKNSIPVDLISKKLKQLSSEMQLDSAIDESSSRSVPPGTPSVKPYIESMPDAPSSVISAPHSNFAPSSIGSGSPTRANFLSSLPSSAIKNLENANLSSQPGSSVGSQSAVKRSTSSAGFKKPRKLMTKKEVIADKKRLAKEKEEEASRKRIEKEKKDRDRQEVLALREQDKAKKEVEKAVRDAEKAVKAKEKAIIDAEKTRKADVKKAEKKRKEDIQLKKDRSQSRVSNFFAPKVKVVPVVVSALSEFAATFKPFNPRDGTIVAPVNRFAHPVLESDAFIALLDQMNGQVDEFFKEFRKDITLVSSIPLCPISMAGVVPVRNWRFLKLSRQIYTRFDTDLRPAYFGTWSKKSSLVTGRKPFRKEVAEVLDYDFDSEGEWEEEEPGEDLVSEADDEPAEKEDEEEQDGWLVPHGYLSDGEGGVDSGDEKKPKVEPKARKLVPLVQVLIGPYQTAGYNYSKIEKFFEMVYPFKTEDEPAEVPRKKAKRSTFPNTLLSKLIDFISSSDLALPKLIEGVILYFMPEVLTKVAVEAEIKRVAVKESRNGIRKWYIRDPEVIAQPPTLVENEMEGIVAVNDDIMKVDTKISAATV